ncbi:MAG: DEAD/DEAH box helicase [Opitutae bacterium]|nr:DEAD/DEAH box helicase [Opitutae bacterium]
MTVDGSEHFLAITLPSRESMNYAPALEFLKLHRFTLDPMTRKWWLRDRHRVLNILANRGPELRESFRAEFTPNFTKNTAHLKPAELAAAISEKPEGYDVSLELKAGAATEAQVRAAVASGRGYVEDGGDIYLVNTAQLAQLETGQRALAGDPAEAAEAQRGHRIPRSRVAEVTDLLETIAPHFQAPESWRTRAAAMRDLAALPPAPMLASLEKTLRPYQRLGAAWLWFLYGQRLGGILADEMGLGKTLQALALLTAATAQRKSSVGASLLATSGDEDREQARSHNSGVGTLRNPDTSLPSLVVVPASLVENWRREAARFAPTLRVFIHHGASRLNAAEFATHDLVLTSYGTLARDAGLFASVEFDLILADEAQHLKNRRTQAAQSLRLLRGRGRFLLTGTPLENSLDDLRSLFEFLMPGFLPRLPAGLKKEERSWHDERLRAQTAPYILRRTKAVVAPELPPKIEQVIYCELTAAQAKLYRTMQEETEREMFDLAAAGASEGRIRLATLTQLLRLRQICCDPRLVAEKFAPPKTVGGAFLSAIASATAERPDTNEPSRHKAAPTVEPDSEPNASEVGRTVPGEPRTNDSSPHAPAPRPRLGEDASPYQDSAKLEAFRELLAESVDEGHRMLVFSQFTSLLALLRAELDAQEVPYCYLDGSMTARARQKEVDRFQGSDAVPVFLISLKAGGTGLNLTGADVVVHYDPWWNPAAEAQATDRTHRIGQTRVVTSYRLICAGTVEEKVMALQQAKRALLADVFSASDAAAAHLSLADLRELLGAT